MKSIVIAGGGLAGLSAALLLNSHGFSVTVVEKKGYPFNKVCGEYVSNEVLPYLNSFDISIDELRPARISKLALTDFSGRRVLINLDLGGFGLSRFTFDNLLFEKAASGGVRFLTGVKVNDICWDGTKFRLSLSDSTMLAADVAVAAYGKRSNLDQKFNRAFFSERSPFLAVKYHIRTDFPADVIQLDSFNGGYCGICKIEDDRYSLCYLSASRHLKKYRTIRSMEENILFKNPYIKRYFTDSEFINHKPDVINEVSFSKKTLVENHVLFCGDAAGMITPLCGNGMAMALHSGKILADVIYDHWKNDPDLLQRSILEANYQTLWKRHFSSRISAGRLIQRIFLQSALSSAGVRIFNRFPQLLKTMVRTTHGSPF